MTSARRFCIPKDNAPRRHVFVGNCGPAVGHTPAAVAEIFSEFGPVEIDVTEPEKSYVFVTFEDAAKAAAAKAHFSHAEHNFILRFTDVKRPKQITRAPELSETAEACGVPGLQLLKDFISDAEEAALLRFAHTSRHCAWEWHTGRRVAHFGVHFDYATRNISRSEGAKPFPECIEPLVHHMEACQSVSTLDQLTVNCYPPGVGLASHIDTHSAFTGAIVILSTGSGAVMQFKKEEARRRLLLPRRSLLILADEARYCWQHCIPHNRIGRESSERYSWTLRQARGFACDCAYPQYCDSQEGALPPTRMLLNRLEEENQPERHQSCQSMEEQHVHRIYDVIARHFSSTRFAVWPKVRAFLESLHSGALMVDVGCGNGKYFNVRNDLVIFGMDHSEGLLKAALDRQCPTGLPLQNRSVVDVFVADGLAIPLGSDKMDAALCIAVLHHVSSIDRRLEILKEMIRVLQPNGQALITVWAQEQEDVEKTVSKWQRIPHQDDPDHIHQMMGTNYGEDYFVPWHLPLHRLEGQIAAQEIQNDQENGGVINEEKRSVMFHRYCHVYVKGELERLCSHVQNARILDAFYDKSNWCVILQKSL